MRLLNTQDQTLTEFLEDCPEYAILSHMWGDDEVTFEDIAKPHAETMAGYNKILKCCRQALNDGFQWVWIDTCCIDKNSSAELTEAINSMYDWYWDAEMCYAYLEDVKQPKDASVGPFHSDFVKSRWFRRGWTLQELLAPPSVVFFDRNWNRFGTKHDMYMIIKTAAGIEEKYIRNRDKLQEASIGTVFGWASKRETKRPEDVAYCLLGFFRVNMPLLYGEGTRAFYRLQLELLRQTEDHTIFAWNPQEGEIYETMGVLAPSPKQFQHIPNVEKAPLHYGVALNHKSADTTYEMTNRGLRIALPRTEKYHNGKLQIVAGLTLRLSTEALTWSKQQHNHGRRSIGTLPSGSNPLWPKPFAVIELEKIGPDRYCRKMSSRVRIVKSSGLSNAYTHRMYIDAESRLKDTTKSRRIPCPMTITSLHCDFAQTELHGVDVYREGQLRAWPNSEEQPDLQKLVIFDSEWASVRLSVWGVSFTIIIGQTQRKAGLLVTHSTSTETFNDEKRLVRVVQKGFEKLHSDVEALAEKLEDPEQYSRVEKSWQLDPNIKVTLRARKTRVLGVGPKWTVAVKILDKNWGIVQGSMEEIEKGLREAGVKGPVLNGSIPSFGPLPDACGSKSSPEDLSVTDRPRCDSPISTEDPQPMRPAVDSWRSLSWQSSSRTRTCDQRA
ncbi:hypothetical protein E8E12_011245 [Didymella heteroderae]|uniref:Heterokaryon incompatibility domain-containing protein n=1 Tax=Didymella heteroderae TaxID=1769908 RepID=A0A9P4WY24_9PLEO|nr:hypothetical protein E8E12_011245 [Didymella heteroderae]